MAKLNNRGDSGQPCLVPLVRGIGEDSAPKVWTLAIGEANILSRKVSKFPVSPIQCKTSNSHDRLMLSKAFSASNAITTRSSSG